MTFFQHFISKIDLCLVFSVLVLIFVGFITIYSATYGSYYKNSLKYISIQLIAFIIGFVCFLFFVNFDYQYYKNSYKIIYIISLIILLSVLLFGSIKRGTKGWFNFSFFYFQPIEITKIMFILSFASFIDIKSTEIKKMSFFISVAGMIFGHLLFIMMQPDFSSTLFYLPVSLIFLFIIGVEFFYILCIVIFGILSILVMFFKIFLDMYFKTFDIRTFCVDIIDFCKTGRNAFYMIFTILFSIFLIWLFLYKSKFRFPIIYIVILCSTVFFGCIASLHIENSLRNYQKKRLITFLNPEIDPKGFGYNIIQSKIAIGSGKLFGKGLKKGTQTQLGFLPEQHTDFIFSVICEEGGWIMSQSTLILYFLMIWRSFVIAKTARDRYGSLVALGLATMFTFYVIINVGMVMGIVPVIGVPLPFVSYGGSSIISSLCAVGILCSINGKSVYINKSKIRIPY
ncbi:MAG: rod shape-determining protein RodA [Endomicrobium sp.]|jgi:rod shape determining protein RodA|nr:rod shape-determining protein RodA [Endomicrobium sp.]